LKTRWGIELSAPGRFRFGGKASTTRHGGGVLQRGAKKGAKYEKVSRLTENGEFMEDQGDYEIGSVPIKTNWAEQGITKFENTPKGNYPQPLRKKSLWVLLLSKKWRRGEEREQTIPGEK